MKAFSISAVVLATIPTAIGNQIYGPYYLATEPSNTNGCLNLTATNNNILLSNDLPPYQFLFDLDSDLVGYLDVLGFGEGYSRVYADGTDGTVRYTNSGVQPPAGSIADQWSMTALEADPSRKVLEFRGGELLACTDATTGVVSLRATSITNAPGCQYVSIASPPT